MDELIAKLAPQFVELIVLVLGALVLAGKTKLTDYIKAKHANATVEGALLWVNEVVWACVAEANQTVVAGAKAALADGKISKEEYDKQLAEVKRAVAAKATEMTFAKVKDVFGYQIHAQALPLIEAKVEQAVAGTKANPT